MPPRTIPKSTPDDSVQGPYLSSNNKWKAFAQILKWVLCWRCVKEDESEKTKCYAGLPTNNLSDSLKIEDEGYGTIFTRYNCDIHEPTKSLKIEVGGCGLQQICLSIFPECEILEATNNLSDSLKIGEGEYGTVYRGKIDNTDVAIKILSNTSEQGMEEFNREIGALNRMKHSNLVKLIGMCSDIFALVYEYVPNGSLEDCLMERSAELTWEIRTRIVYEICNTLMFLHSKKPDPLVHGDLKPRNVLLAANFKTKLADFGLCRFLTQVGNSGKFHLTKKSFGTPGYIDPDFLESGVVKPAIDVYSFGKTFIRILTNERPGEISRKVHEARKTKCLMTIVDPAVRGWPEEIVELLALFALRCCKYHRYKPEFMRKFYTDLQTMLDDYIDYA